MRLYVLLFMVVLLSSCATGISKQELMNLANKGDPERQYQLANKYYSGDKDFLRDYEKAHQWYLKSAKQNYYKSQSMLGMMYKLGVGVKKDWAKAEKWYKKSIENGDTVSIGNLGMLYYDKGNIAESKKWLDKSLSLDDYYSLRGRGGAYLYLAKISADKRKYEDAYKWYSLALISGAFYEKRKTDLSLIKKLNKISNKLSVNKKLRVAQKVIDLYYEKSIKHKNYVKFNKVETYKNIVILNGKKTLNFIGYLLNENRKSFATMGHFSKKDDDVSRAIYAQYTYIVAGHFLEYGNIDINFSLAKGYLEVADKVFSKKYDKKRLGFLDEIVKAKLDVVKILAQVQKQSIEEFKLRK